MQALTNLELTTRLLALEQAFIEAQNRNIDNTYRSEANERNITRITPYTETKTAYIDDTFIVFTNVPDGNLTIYFDKPYKVDREADRVTVRFEALEEVTPITISII